MFWNWVKEKTKQQHHNVGDTTQLSKEIKPSKNSSRIEINFLSYPELAGKKLVWVSFPSHVDLKDASDLVKVTSYDPIIKNLYEPIFELEVLFLKWEFSDLSYVFL